jgi:hypothetical protein
MSLGNSKYCVNELCYLDTAKLEWCWKAMYLSSTQYWRLVLETSCFKSGEEEEIVMGVMDGLKP